MSLSLIVAASENNVIGVDGGLPWKLPKDMQRFAELTAGHPVIMGRKTYESIPSASRPLPGRKNVVVTRQSKYAAPGCIVVYSLAEALAAAGDGAFVIGGAEFYRQMLPLADRIELTRVHVVLRGDVTFPQIDASWKEVARDEHPADERHPYPFTFLTYERAEE